MTFKEFFSFRANITLWGNLLAVFILTCVLILGVWLGLGYYTLHGDSIEIPTVKGLAEQDAVKLIESRGLKAEISDSIYVKGQSAGRIVDQDPVSGARVKQGRTVYLTINSLSVPMTRLPDVANNSSVRQATAKLISSGFRLTEEEYINGDRDWVYDVKMNGRTLKEGESVPIGATLTLVVGSGGSMAAQSDLSTTYDEDLIPLDDNASASDPEPHKEPKKETQPASTRDKHEDSWF